MNDATSQALEQAFEHIEAGRPDDAIPLLEPIVADDPDNLDAWWILAHASSDPQKARRALNNVLRLDPDYPGAAALLEVLNEKYPPPRIRRIEAVSTPETMPEAPQALPEPPPAVLPPAPPAREQAKAAQPSPAARRSGLPIPLLASAAVILVLVILLLLTSGGGGDTDAQNTAQTQTAVALLAAPATETPSIIVVDASPTPETVVEVTDEPSFNETAEATPEPIVIETAQATPEPETTPELEATAEVTVEAGGGSGEDEFAGILSALARYTLPDAPVEVVDTSLGSTLLASVCSAPGREARTRVEEVLTLAARESAGLPESIDAVGARMVNCDDGSTILALGVDRVTAVGFAQRSVSARDFSAAWRPVR
ncbi:MAG: hypothetical protein CUN53_02495 [Phototrophicales bacterium]|nr:MAG: hypothetical protein CUN53_02495 [Phototrophicales bacterium]